ncbi:MULTISPECIES: Asp23/Gls24 family envelope stress response protein [unclassified Streptomyces]|uniref:Asp23/Gls24 family envelope stress response protein n=1 Tax=unclassified Streptomyces TaxID=2593676 RepID=UPI0036532D49
MTRYAVHDTLTEALARTVLEVSGVAFLKPGLGDLLRSRAGAGAGRSGGHTAGIRVTRRDESEPWEVDVRIVARKERRTVDVARATRQALEESLATLLPDSKASVRVTVTGLV